MKQLNILSVSDVLFFNSMKFYYKHKHKEVSAYFALFTSHKRGSSYDYSTHQINNFKQIERTLVSLIFGIICRKQEIYNK